MSRSGTDESPDAPIVDRVCAVASSFDGDVVDVVRRAAAIVDPLASAAQRARLIAAACARLDGLAELQPFLDDPHVDEVLVNAGGEIWIDRDGALVPVGRIPEARLAAVIERAVAPVGRRLDRSAPIIDARLPTGQRLCVVIPPVAVDGPTLSVRRFARARRHIDDFADADGVALCTEIIEARCNFIVSGATSSGKTSLVAALVDLARADRLVIVEDTTELPCRGGNVVRLESRPPSVEGPPPIDLAALVRTSLRLRPDRIVVGEVRGDEALALVQAMNTGHDGSCSTCHANSATDALARLETLLLQAAPGWPLDAIRGHLRRSIDVVIHVARDGGRRRVVEVHEIDSEATGGSPVNTTPLARLRGCGTLTRSAPLTPHPFERPPGGAELTTWLTVGAAVAVVALVAAGMAPRPRSRRPSPPAREARAPAAGEHAPSERHRLPTVRWVTPPAETWRRMRRRRRALGPVAVAEWCDDIARSIRAGDTLRAAVSATPDHAGVAAATAPFRARLARGEVVADSAERVEQTGHQPHLAMATSVIAASSRLGEVRAEPFDRVAAVLRLRDADQQERAVHSAQAAMSARVLTALPVAMLALLLVTDSDVRTALTQPVGATLVALGTGFNTAGLLWMRRIVRARS